MAVAMTASTVVDGLARARFMRLCALAALAYCSYACASSFSGCGSLKTWVRRIWPSTSQRSSNPADEA